MTELSTAPVRASTAPEFDFFDPDPAFDIYADPDVEKILSILNHPQQIHRPVSDVLKNLEGR